MLLNIYSNAIKFTGRGTGKDGKICVMVELIMDSEDDQRLRISVVDNGYGIKKLD